LPTDRAVQFEFFPPRNSPLFAHVSVFGFLLGLIVLCLAAERRADCQDASNPAGLNALADVTGTADAIPSPRKNLLSETPTLAETLTPPEMDSASRSEGTTTTATQSKVQVESELIVEGLASYGHYKIFASGSDCKLYTAGVEYDRHSWGSFLKARVDYVAEFLPVVLLYAPLTQDIWGTPTSPYKHIVPGVGIAPIGFRMLWRDHKAIMPYLEAKGGILGFTQKVLSQEATYEDFSLQSGTGLKVKMNQRWDMRLGLFSDFHFSNGFMVPVDPGLDVMNANLGLVYHFGTRNP
jgi:Lipid A 3-O-deacylase (PagL)